MTQLAETHEDDAMRQGTRMARRFMVAFGLVTVALVIALVTLGSEWRDAISIAEAKGRKLRAIHHGQWGMWWGCAAAAVLSGALTVTSWWWGRVPASPAAAPLSTPRMTRGAWAMLLVILAIAGALRWEHLGLSLYNDEAQSFRRFVAGQNLLQSDGSVRWHEVPWWETLWLNKTANNSMPCSIFGRLSYETWRDLTGATQGAVSERAVRLPVMLAAMAGLFVLWLVTRRLLPDSSACWWVLVLATLHPWHMRYSSEARGHGLLLLGVPLCFWFLQRALEDDRWRWWIGMGLAQFFCLWGFQGSAGYFVVFNSMLLAGMAWRAMQKKDRWGRLARPIVGMAVGAMVTLPVMLPMMEQLAEAMRTLDSLKGHMGLDWWKDVASLMQTGLVWVDRDVVNDHNLALSHFVNVHPWLWVLAPGALVPVLAGARVLWRRDIPAMLALIAGPLAAVGMVAILSPRGTFLYPWYLIFMLSGFLIVWAAGLAALVDRVRNPAARVAVLALLIIPMTGLVWANVRTMEAPKEDLRGLAQAVPAGALHGSLFSDVDVYDPDVVILSGMASLDQLMADARAKGTPLYVSFSRRNHSPEFEAFYRRVETGGEFEYVTKFQGQQEEQFTHRLYRMRQGKSE